MYSKSFLKDGSLRLKSDRCAFLFVRPQPGVIYTAVAGQDTGEFGLSVLEEIENEVKRFKRPISWFVDTHESSAATNEVAEQWGSWLNKNKDYFETVCVLASSKSFNLKIEIASHLANTRDTIQVHKHGESFFTAMEKCLGRKFTAPGKDWISQDPAIVKIVSLPNSSTEISDGRCIFTFERLAETDTLLTTISGIDQGSLGNYPFDYMQAELDSFRGRPINWQINCKDTRLVTTNIIQEWIEWILCRRESFKKVDIHTPVGAVPLSIDIARHRLNANSVIKLHA